MSAVSREKTEKGKSGLEYDSMDLFFYAYSAAGKVVFGFPYNNLFVYRLQRLRYLKPDLMFQRPLYFVNFPKKIFNDI